MHKIIVLIFIIFSLILFSCNEDSTTSIETNSDSIELHKSSVRYEAKPGIIFGIWPQWERWLNKSQLETLKNTYGFNYMMVNSCNMYVNNAHKLAVENVFQTYSHSNVLVCIKDHWPMDTTTADPFDKDTLNPYWNRYTTVTSHPDLSNSNLYGYYLDEPAEWNVLRSTIKFIKDSLTNLNPNPIFFVGMYRLAYPDGFNTTIFPLDPYRLPVSYFAEKLFYSTYSKHDNPAILDQRSSWDAMDSKYSSYFRGPWISLLLDKTEYDDLLNRAKSYNEVWLFEHDTSNADDFSEIEVFCEKAYQAGYLNKYN